MNKTSLIIIAIIVLLVVGGGAFYGGMTYGKSHPVIRPGAPLNNGAKFSARFSGANGAGAGANGGGFISGNIISKDSSSITVQLPSNSGSKIIFYSDTTQVSKLASGTSADFITGTAVSITGTTNSDGSVTAQTIQIRPVGKDKTGSQNLGQ